MSETLSDKTAFITGGARGIGRATALKPASAGCDVAIVHNNSHGESEAGCEEIRAIPDYSFIGAAKAALKALARGPAFEPGHTLVVDGGYCISG